MRQFVESLKRLYQSGMVNEEKVESLFLTSKLSEEEKMYILDV